MTDDTKWYEGELSAIRSFLAELDLIEKSIREGQEPLERLRVAREWLNKWKATIPQIKT